MNYDIPVRHLARAWFHQAPKVNASKFLTELSKVLDTEFELSTAMRIDAQSGVAGPSTTLASRETGWQLTSAPGSIDLELHGRDKEISALNVFLRKAGEVMVLASSQSNVSAHRLAAITEGFLGEMSSSTHNRVAKQLLKYPRSFEPAPFEWDWRCVQHVDRAFAGLTEPTNTIATAKRMSGTLIDDGGNQVAFDRVRVDFDINTLPRRTDARFASGHIRGFFDEATKWHNELSTEFSGFAGIGGQS